MALKEVWIGSVGPLVYDDDDVYADDPTIKHMGIRTDGFIRSTLAPVVGSDMLRKDDIGDGTLTPQFEQVGIGIDPDVLLHLSNVDGGLDCLVNLDCYDSINYNTAVLSFRKSSSDTQGVKTLVAPGEGLGQINFLGVNDAITPDFAYGARIRAICGGMGTGDYVRALLTLSAYDRYGDENGVLQICGNTGYIGIGPDSTPCSTLEVADYLNIVTLYCTNEGDGDGDRHSDIVARGKQSGGELSSLGAMIFSHDGSEDDERGKFTIKLNSCTEGWIPTEKFKLDSDGVITSPSGINMVCSDDEIVCHNDEIVFSCPTRS